MSEKVYLDEQGNEIPPEIPAAQPGAMRIFGDRGLPSALTAADVISPRNAAAQKALDGFKGNRQCGRCTHISTSGSGGDQERYWRASWITVIFWRSSSFRGRDGESKRNL